MNSLSSRKAPAAQFNDVSLGPSDCRDALLSGTAVAGTN